MIPDTSSLVTKSPSTITSTLNDYRTYSTHSSSSYSSPSYLTSHSPLIRSHSSKNTAFFDTPKYTSSKLHDLNRCLTSKQYGLDDYSTSSSYRSSSIADKYFKPSATTTSSVYDKKKSLQVSPSSTYTKYQPNYRSSSLPICANNSYSSKTVDARTLDGNANYHRVTNGIDLLAERRSIPKTSSLISKKYETNNYNLNDTKKETDEKKFDVVGQRKKYINDDNSNDNSDDAAGRNAKWSGLRNIGNTCYMNSILQCLSCTKLLKEYVISKNYVRHVNQDGKLINAFNSLLSKMWTQAGPVDVSAFKDTFQRLAPQFAGYEQHDAQEFLRFLVDKLHADVNRVQVKPKNLPEINDKLSDNSLASEHWKRYLQCENSYILDLFGGQLKSTLECLVCGHKSVTFEIFWDLSLPLPSYTSYNSNVSINDILRNFTQEEILDNREKPKCAHCKIEQRMSKAYSFQKLPKYLVLHLKRFQTTSSYRKLSTVVQFPLTGLDMSPYLAKAVTSSRMYNLYAVSNHVGTPFTGHYTANCKHPLGSDWYTCNDSSVSKIALPVSSKIVNADAYILFYEAVD